jgi:hypothetical protein
LHHISIISVVMRMAGEGFRTPAQRHNSGSAIRPGTE